MTPLERDGGLELGPARFPEMMLMCTEDDADFSPLASNSLLLDATGAGPMVSVPGYEVLHD